LLETMTKIKSIVRLLGRLGIMHARVEARTSDGKSYWFSSIPFGGPAMIGVEILGIASGKCTWCSKEKDEVVNFAFADKSFAGAMCWNDFKRALRMKLPAPQQGKQVGNEAEAAALR
jgi:hypothetical protein